MEPNMASDSADLGIPAVEKLLYQGAEAVSCRNVFFYSVSPFKDLHQQYITCYAASIFGALLVEACRREAAIEQEL